MLPLGDYSGNHLPQNTLELSLGGFDLLLVILDVLIDRDRPGICYACERSRRGSRDKQW